MSEYQLVVFRAIDAPVSPKNLAYMRTQSSRAEITKWSFENEYHFGDFRGNAEEMLRRGYDFHLHYANFGARTLMFRLPTGLPDPAAAEHYFHDDSFHFAPDKSGPGGILHINPYYEAGHLDNLWDAEDLINRLLPLRAEILTGDLRPLYLAHLAAATDGNHNPEDENDAPVPAGLHKVTPAQRALTKLYGLPHGMISAAAQASPPLPTAGAAMPRYADWLARQPDPAKNAWLQRLMEDPESAVRAELLAEYQKSTRSPAWPTSRVDRTIASLQAEGEEIEMKRSRLKAEKAAKAREQKLAAMAADPAKTLRETEDLIKYKSAENYAKIASLLQDLRTALAPTSRSDIAEKQAQKLKSENPGTRGLPAELKRHGFLKK